jgi:hypothetical protein
MIADGSGGAVESVGLWPLAPWDSGFESHQGQGCLSLVKCFLLSSRGLCIGMRVMCLIECSLETWIMKRPWLTKGCCSFGKGERGAGDHNLLLYLQKITIPKVAYSHHPADWNPEVTNSNLVAKIRFRDLFRGFPHFLLTNWAIVPQMEPLMRHCTFLKLIIHWLS